VLRGAVPDVLIDILLALFLWSSSGVIIRRSGLPVHVLIFYACIVSFLFLGPALLRKTGRTRPQGFRALRLPVVLGAVGLVNTFSYYFALKHTSIANAVLTHYTAPVIVAFLAPAFLGEKITRRAVAAIVMASIGLYLMLNGFTFARGDAAGLAAGLISGFAYAVLIIIGRFLAGDFSPVLLTFIQNVVVAAGLAPFVREAPFDGLAYYLAMGIPLSTVAPVLYYRGLRQVAANRAAVLGYLEPVSAILLAVFFLHELPGWYSIFGGALIILSGYLTMTKATPDTAAP
jgi:drug/metabolite transporter (DMT)-like permease